MKGISPVGFSRLTEVIFSDRKKKLTFYHRLLSGVAVSQHVVLEFADPGRMSCEVFTGRKDNRYFFEEDDGSK